MFSTRPRSWFWPPSGSPPGPWLSEFAQWYQVVVADWTWALSEDISELLSDWAVTTLTTTLASPNRTTSPMISLPLMVRYDSTLAHRASRPWGRAARAGISSPASARNRRRGRCG